MARRDLCAGWQLLRVSKDFKIGQLAALLAAGGDEALFSHVTLPAQVHDVLLAHGKIKNPNWSGQNHDQWIGESDWVYCRRFSDRAPGGRWTLRLEGVDTFLDVYLNGRFVGSHESAFLPCVLPGLTLGEENLLALHFKSPVGMLEGIQAPPKYEGNVPKYSMARVFRSGFHDFNGPIPDLIRVGISGPVSLIREDQPAIRDCVVDSELDSSLQQGSVRVRARYYGPLEGLCLVAKLWDQDGSLAAQESGPPDGAMELTLLQPRLWWPRTHGTPHVYRLELLLMRGDQVLDCVERTLGLRRVEMESNFALHVNGRRVRLWGANLAHMDTLSGCYSPPRAQKLLELCVLGNFNCLRVWGESEVLDDAFYEQCDRLGILLWQDFYLCYSMYSEQPEFLDLCKREAEALVVRLRHHPSLLLWCGGNEMLLHRDYDHPGAYCWGEKIFKDIYPEVCGRLDPDRLYHPCSPSGGKYANDPLEGDTHGYTHLWVVPGARYPAFASENCRVSAPAMRTMQRMMTPEELWPKDYSGLLTKERPLVWPESWCRHNSNQGHLKVGPVEQFHDAGDAPSLIYRLGAAHALYIKKDVERFRRGRPDTAPYGPRCTNGHLLWKLNNNSNIFSYGVVDYFCEPMMAYYALRRAYEPLLVSFSVEDHISVWVTNDTPAPVEGSVEVRLFSLVAGQYSEHVRFPFRAQPDESVLVGDLDCFLQFRRHHVLVARVYDREGMCIGGNEDFVDLERHLVFPSDPQIQMQAVEDGIELWCREYARCVELLGDSNGEQFGWLFSDNYFDLLPGEIKKVQILGTHQQGIVSAKAYYADIGCSVQWMHGEEAASGSDKAPQRPEGFDA